MERWPNEIHIAVASYIQRIRNEKKRDYAQRYRTALEAGLENEVERNGLGGMAAQAVRFSIHEIVGHI